ncbi:hypothetical protein FOA52_006737 [Chlamydomonas sp. UWO 241]|nr:hypothetical protein FOA52_006737 [Chlamydomonas sp. UWO 241]
MHASIIPTHVGVVFSTPVSWRASKRCVVVRAQEPPPGGKKKGFFHGFFDFASWAPRSSRAWRLNQYDYEGSTKGDESEEAVADLEERLRKTSKASSSSPAASVDQEGSLYDQPAPARSFEDAADSDLASALSSRMRQLTVDPPSDDDEGGEGEPEVAREEVPITGKELRALVFAKYGKNYDLSLVRRDIPGKTFVCLNVMWSFLEQRSFKLTLEQYEEKLDSIAYLLNAVKQADAIRTQLSGPARSQNGMPRRPVTGTAISLKLQVSEATVREWFGRGYQ